jgi:PAS domain S-box-containing protein
MERISGLRSDAVLGRPAFELFPFLKETGEDKYFYEALAGRNAVAESRPYFIPSTGHHGFFDGYYSPLWDEHGEVIGGVGVIRNITVNHRAEEALRSSEERYRAFISNSSEGIWRCELEQPVPTDLPADEQIELFYQHGFLAECNDAMARMYGFDRAEEITNAQLSDLLVRDDPKNVEYLRAFIASGYHLTDAESVEVNREGHQRFFLNNLVGVIENGLTLRAWGTQRDITKRKRIEEELKATEHRFFMFMEHLPGLAWIKDLEGRYVYVNEAAAKAFRSPREELRGKTDDEIFPPETAATFRKNDNLAVTGGAGVLTVEALEQEDGVHHSIVSKFPVPGPDGETLMIGGIAIDITERMRAEDALRESEEKYRGLLENANDFIYSHNLHGNYLTINRACEKITGYTRQEVLGGLNISQVVVPEHLEFARKMIDLKLRDPSPTVYEIDIFTKDGRRLTLEVSTRVSHRDGHGAIIEGIARDVTERKRGELEREELLRREQRARRDAEEALDVARSIENSLGVLVEASGVLLGSLTLEDVQPAILDLSRRLISADAYAIWRGDAQAKVWRIVSSAGLSEEYRGQRIEGWEPGYFVFDQPMIAEDIEQIAQLEARREQYKSEGIRSMLAVPMHILGHASGTLTYYYWQPHHFSDRELRVATALANLASAAIGSAELYDEQRRLRSEAQTSEWRSNFLAKASRVLSSTLDSEATLSRVAQLCVPDLADWCAVDILDEDHTVRRLSVAHIDPAKVEWAHEIQQRYPPQMDAPRGVPQVLRTGVSEIYPEITDELLTDGATDEEHLRLLRTVGLSSVMLVPLLAHGSTYGVITFVTAESGRRYDAQDLILAEDLARRAAVAVENARLYQAAQNASRLKDEFLATVSHELRTPLTAILGWATMLRSNRVQGEALQRALETIERSAKNQNQIIEDLLDVSRIITGKLRLEIRPVDLASLIQTAVESLHPAADANKVRLLKLLDTGLHSFSGDPSRLQQIVWNLLSNAIKFTPQGGRVQIMLERIDSHVEIVVSDTGQGISAQFLPFVFDRFRQADSTTTRKHGGLGLGLAIVRHLVELHGGTVQAESEGEGQGSTFTVVFPLMPVYQRTATKERVHPVASDNLLVFDYHEKLTGLKILAVDDEADTCELVKAALEQCGAEVTTARSAQEAMKQLERFVPDVLISDIGMPREDGYELIRRVRQLPSENGGAVPAVALTSYARAEDRLRILREGYQMHVPKPVELAELVAVVASLVLRARPS